MHDDPSAQDLDDQLWGRLEKLKPRLDHFRIREAHFPSDVTVAALGMVVWEASNALLLLVRDKRYLAGMNPEARLTLEAGMEALLPAWRSPGLRACRRCT